MTNVKDLYQQHYEFQRRNDACTNSKIRWAANYIFDLTTYDSELDELFVKAIVDVCHAIHERKTFEYIRDPSKYKRFILVCQMLDKFHWIEWGTSIRGAWFDNFAYHPYINSKDIVEEQESWGPEWDENGKLMKHTIEAVPFTEENLMALIEFLEEE